MRARLEPLLCELHAHTRWSDGDLTVAELVDLYGRNGFDVLCVTDHVVARSSSAVYLAKFETKSHAPRPEVTIVFGA
jgi:predicted metal-dependent phosphoesterase TrpH